MDSKLLWYIFTVGKKSIKLENNRQPFGTENGTFGNSRSDGWEI